jgi:hypothetical protein
VLAYCGTVCTALGATITCDATGNINVCPGAPAQNTVAAFTVTESQISTDLGAILVRQGIVVLCEIDLVNGKCPDGPPDDITANYSDEILYFSRNNHAFASETSDNEDGTDDPQDVPLQPIPNGTVRFDIREPDAFPEVVTYVAMNTLDDGTKVKITYTLISDSPEPAPMASIAIGIVTLTLIRFRRGKRASAQNS